YTVVKGDTCASVAKQYGISKGEFFKLNSELSTTCSNLNIGYSYCISPAVKAVTNFSAKTKSDNNDSSSEKRKIMQSNIPMTYYWIAMPKDYDQSGKKVEIKSCNGKVLGTTSVEYADALVMEGTGVLGDKIVNLGSCGCTNYNCFMELDKHEDPFGLTSYSTPLRPFVTVAANDIPRGTKIYVPQLDGWKLPGGKSHNGCLLVEDKGWSFSSHHIDFYVYAMDHYETLNREHRISRVDVYEGGSCNLIDYM
ncbi:hypothetical protein BX666DRAFT_1847522, partial [Dichotomocladium elegans]